MSPRTNSKSKSKSLSKSKSKSNSKSKSKSKPKSQSTTATVSSLLSTPSVGASLRYPTDADGFAIPVNDPRQWLETADKYNFVVVSILGERELAESRRALWSHMGDAVRADDSTTWETKNWPQPDSPHLTTDLALDECAFRNRLNPTLVRLFQTLYGTKELQATVDCYGVKRGTVFASHERADWRRKALRLHWDSCPQEYVVDRARGRRRFQALVALSDNSHLTGSFACVPGSANDLERWTDAYQVESRKYVPRGNPLHRHVQRIPLRAGDVVVWDVGVAHANFANHSCDARLTQYCRMVPRADWALERESACTSHFWKSGAQGKKEKTRIDKLKWTPYERRLLALD